MRLLLTKVCGPTSFKSLRTVNGVCHATFRDACKDYGLLDDDKEWHEVIQQCANGGLPPQIRQLFVHIIVNCKVTDLLHLWNSHWKHMVEDILLKRRQLAKDDNLMLNDKQVQFYALAGTSLQILLKYLCFEYFWFFIFFAFFMPLYLHYIFAQKCLICSVQFFCIKYFSEICFDQIVFVFLHNLSSLLHMNYILNIHSG